MRRRRDLLVGSWRFLHRVCVLIRDVVLVDEMRRYVGMVRRGYTWGVILIRGLDLRLFVRNQDIHWVFYQR